MDYEIYRIPSYFVVILFGSAFNARFMGVSVVAAVAIASMADNVGGANFIIMFYVSALILSGFRE